MMVELTTYDIAEFLQQYYPPYAEYDYEHLVEFCNYMQDRTVAMWDQDRECIAGVALYFRLDDPTYEMLDCLDVTSHAIIAELWKQNGKNIHFVVIAGNAGGQGFRFIKEGMRIVILKENPKTLSWYDKTMCKLHRHEITEEYKLCL